MGQRLQGRVHGHAVRVGASAQRHGEDFPIQTFRRQSKNHRRLQTDQNHLQTGYMIVIVVVSQICSSLNDVTHILIFYDPSKSQCLMCFRCIRYFCHIIIYPSLRALRQQFLVKFLLLASNTIFFKTIAKRQKSYSKSIFENAL